MDVIQSILLKSMLKQRMEQSEVGWPFTPHQKGRIKVMQKMHKVCTDENLDIITLNLNSSTMHLTTVGNTDQDSRGLSLQVVKY